MGLRLMLLTCALGACSPYGGGAFECSLDTQCSGGTCSDGFCAFPDGECDSGLRYGELSGPRAGQCVGGSMMMDDAAMLDTPDTQLPDATNCYGGFVTACFVTPPTGAITLPTNINTGTSPDCDTDPRNAAWCVIAGATITISGTVTVIGTKPLVLVATQTITNNGTLDVASHRAGGILGAGGNATGCSAGTAPGTSGGGAGGSFGGAGGAGGGTNMTGTAGGVAGTTTPNPTTLRGGCAGQNGNGTAAGTGGAGGGAVYLIAETSINNIGSINASGAGATPGTTNVSGAGGGGSGGMIGLDSPVCMNTGNVFANGGGGAEGSGNSTPGNAGNDPVGGAGGTAGSLGSTNGGDGGAGQGGATANAGTGLNGTATGGGGGGGGGVGVIKAQRCTLGGTVSPNPS